MVATDDACDIVTIAILAKDKAHSLPLYLKQILAQTYPKDKTYLYIRTNNNNDGTVAILQNFIDLHGTKYIEVYFDASDVEAPVQTYGQHEWNPTRFKVLGKIRQESMAWARAKHSHYFVCDCDNFIYPNTLEDLMKAGLPIVAPLLHTGESPQGRSIHYSNYHAAIDANGYYADTPIYLPLWSTDIKGYVQVPVVHCTYLVDYQYLDSLCYDDGTGRYEYVIFSHSARKADIPQYLDTHQVYGRITFAENAKELAREEWLLEFMDV